MTSTIDRSLDVTKEVQLSASLYIAARGQRWRRVYDLPETLSIQAAQRSTPTLTINASWTEPEFNWQDFAPTTGQLTAMRFNISMYWYGQGTYTLPLVGWISNIKSTRTEHGQTVAITLHSADWIIQEHTIKDEVSEREAFRENPDSAWREWFMTERLGLDFAEFVEMHTDTTEAGTIQIPIAGGSSLWDVASNIALALNDRYVAGISHSFEQPSGFSLMDSLDYAIPAITLPRFARDDRPAIDLRTNQGRVIEEVLESPGDWADILVHNRRQLDRTESDGSMIETTTRYGDQSAQSDLRTEATHTSWATRERPEIFADMLERERAKKWKTTLVTQLDPRIWLGTGCLTDTGDLWVSGISINLAAAEMELELSPQRAQIILTTWQDIQPETGRTWSTMLGESWEKIGL